MNCVLKYVIFLCRYEQNGSECCLTPISFTKGEELILFYRVQNYKWLHFSHSTDSTHGIQVKVIYINMVIL